jgi:hypothetical protein
VSLETREIGLWCHSHSNYAATSKRMHIVAPQPWTRPSYTAIFGHPPRSDGPRRAIRERRAVRIRADHAILVGTRNMKSVMDIAEPSSHRCLFSSSNTGR